VKFLHGFKRFFSVFLFKSFLNEFFCGFVGLQRLILVVNHGIFTVFKEFLGFHDFEQNSFELLRIYIDFGFVDVLEQERGRFTYSPVFYSEIRTGIFKNS